MQQTPDLSSIVSLIMQNPALIEQISALAKPKSDVEATPVSEPEEVENKESAQTAQANAVPLMRSHRRDLLNAMKPYLSENRRMAIDSMSSILDVIDVMAKGR